METQCRYRTHRHCYSDTSVLCLSKRTQQTCTRSNSDSGQLEVYSNDLYFDRKFQTERKTQIMKQTGNIARCCKLFQVNSCCLEVQNSFRKKWKRILALLYLCLIVGQNVYNVKFEKDRKHFEQDKIGETFVLADLLRFHTFSLSVGIVMPSNMDKYFNNIANGQIQRANDSMSIEMLRIYSLRNFPRKINISMIRLARAGFYSTGNSTETICFRCGVIYRDWISGDDPMHIHRHLSPTCDLVSNGDGRDNIGEELQNSRRQERGEGQSSNPNDISIGNVSLPSNENIGLLNNVTSKQYHHYVSHINPSARNFDHHDTVRGEPTEISIPRIQSHESNTYTHSNKISNSNCNINSQNMSTKNDSPASDFERNCTNNQAGWPGYLNQTPRAMALAGFLFAGYHDYTRCFHCGGGLRNWEAGDDPWVEHARWFPQCGFLQLNKGENFIQAVLKKHNMDQRAKGNSTFSPKVDRTGTTFKNVTMASASASGLDQSSMCTPSIQSQNKQNS
ncbi:Hypothetical predicted protein [Mytilus galloprovincialis]|uniref:BIRC2_3 n=1 Tax=Mytilus galloprovincialis TaxID=29158 RepID=A0A8B6DCG1_MYTGA|nr:Hypothetical predicted protein [Mytilus galloprovincialis]